MTFDVSVKKIMDGRVRECMWVVITCVTMPVTSPVLDGRRIVLDSLARLEKAETYCSATAKEAAAFPFWKRKRKQVQICFDAEEDAEP